MLIAGASQGLGQAMAYEMAQYGHNIVVNYYPGMAEQAQSWVETFTRAKPFCSVLRRPRAGASSTLPRWWVRLAIPDKPMTPHRKAASSALPKVWQREVAPDDNITVNAI